MPDGDNNSVIMFRYLRVNVLEPMTLYRALYGEQGLWVRPAAMFGETVVIDGVTQARFARLPPEDQKK